jgi:hypothetical protein
MKRFNINRSVGEIPLDHKKFMRIMGFGQTLTAPYKERFDTVSSSLSKGNAFAQIAIFDEDKVLIQFDRVSIIGTTLNIGKRVASQLNGCNSIAFFICTLGSEFEKKMKAFQHDPLEAYFADTIGSIKCETFANQVHQHILIEVSKTGYSVTNRYSPGYCNWGVSDQHKIFSFFGDSQTEITLNDSSLMSPIKSISGIVGTGKDVKNRPYTCDTCADARCTYRKFNT